MPIKIECHRCDASYRLPEEAAGKTVRCKNCGASIAVPTEVDDAVDVTDDIEEDDRSPLTRRIRSAQPRRTQPRRSADASPALRAGLISGAAVFCVGLVGIAVLALVARSPARRDADTSAQSLFPAAQVAVPTFPELGTPRILQPSGVRMWFVQMPRSAGPGQSMAMRIYLPPGDAQNQSLPCVLVAPAGTNLLVGNDMDADDYHAETLPYAEAGMAVVFYSLDGGLADMENASNAQFAAAYQKFRAACAGVVNGRNALEFVLARVPQVNPRQIYAAGHSSAATVALLLAAHEPRLAGSIAYAPCTDVELRLAEAARDRTMRTLLTGLPQFLKQSSPKTHVAHIGCPVFLFHAHDDSNVPITESQTFARQLAAAGKRVDFQTVPDGDHYDSMVHQGIPLAIQWLQQHRDATR